MFTFLQWRPTSIHNSVNTLGATLDKLLNRLFLYINMRQLHQQLKVHTAIHTHTHKMKLHSRSQKGESFQIAKAEKRILYWGPAPMSCRHLWLSGIYSTYISSASWNQWWKTWIKQTKISNWLFSRSSVHQRPMLAILGKGTKCIESVPWDKSCSMNIVLALP